MDKMWKAGATLAPLAKATICGAEQFLPAHALLVSINTLCLGKYRQDWNHFLGLTEPCNLDFPELD